MHAEPESNDHILLRAVRRGSQPTRRAVLAAVSWWSPSANDPDLKDGLTTTAVALGAIVISLVVGALQTLFEMMTIRRECSGWN
jgi:hypothetical protein